LSPKTPKKPSKEKEGGVTPMDDPEPPFPAQSFQGKASDTRGLPLAQNKNQKKVPKKKAPAPKKVPVPDEQSKPTNHPKIAKSQKKPAQKGPTSNEEKQPSGDKNAHAQPQAERQHQKSSKQSDTKKAENEALKAGEGVAVMAASDVGIDDPITPVDLKVDVKPDEISSGLTADATTATATTNAGGRKVKGGLRHRHSSRHKHRRSKLRSQLSALHHHATEQEGKREASRKSSINSKKYAGVKNTFRHKNRKRTNEKRRNVGKKMVHAVDQK